MIYVLYAILGFYALAILVCLGVFIYGFVTGKPVLDDMLG